MDPALHSLVDRIRAATADATPLRIRGGGTKDFYGESSEGALLDTRSLTGITSYEPSELVVTVRAGTPLAELDAELASCGQCLAFEPPQFAEGTTVGGMVAAGLAGPSRASVGSVRDYVLGAMLVNGLGEVLGFGGQVMKNVAGYDVSRVLAGSMGTLGLIAEVSLKVLPSAPAEATLRFECSQADALDLLHGWGGRPLPLNASCWVEDAGVGMLYLRLRGAVAAVESACTQMGGERQDTATSAADWAACRDQRLPWFAEQTEQGARELWRLSLPQTAPVLALPGATLVEWHGGLRWYAAEPGEGGVLRAAARDAGGHATLFRAATAPAPGVVPGVASTPRFTPSSPALERIQHALKNAFDPAGIFNRGRLLRG